MPKLTVETDGRNTKVFVDGKQVGFLQVLSVKATPHAIEVFVKFPKESEFPPFIPDGTEGAAQLATKRAEFVSRLQENKNLALTCPFIIIGK